MGQATVYGGAVSRRRRCLTNWCIQRRRMIEVEQILQRIGKLIAACEVQSYVINRQKAALDQRQQRRMIADAVRDVAGFRERGNCNEWKTGTQLIEIGALRRIRTGWIGSQRRAEQFRIGDAGIDGA